MSEHDMKRLTDYTPNKVKWVTDFIKDVGFPIFAFIILAWFHFVALDRNTKVLGELKDVMISVKAALEK